MLVKFTRVSKIPKWPPYHVKRLTIIKSVETTASTFHSFWNCLYYFLISNSFYKIYCCKLFFTALNSSKENTVYTAIWRLPSLYYTDPPLKKCLLPYFFLMLISLRSHYQMCSENYTVKWNDFTLFSRTVNIVNIKW